MVRTHVSDQFDSARFELLQSTETSIPLTIYLTRHSTSRDPTTDQMICPLSDSLAVEVEVQTRLKIRDVQSNEVAQA